MLTQLYISWQATVFETIGSWLARANDTSAHYAAIHCPRQRTIRSAVRS